AIVAYSVDDSAYVAYAKEGNEVTPAPPAGLDRSQRIWLVIDRRRLESDALLAQLAERELPLKPVERPVEFARRLSLVPCTVEEPVSGDDAGP
ncbi:MAG TPA: hypothetical protein PKC18_11465, partial [Lacipirellulaceae bacterium]|nr:hypothetical protein [Lacipirellulaceae bacterium]